MKTFDSFIFRDDSGAVVASNRDGATSTVFVSSVISSFHHHLAKQIVF